MTSAALFVLFLAHACSIIGTPSDPGADYDPKPTMVTHKHNKWTTSYKKNSNNINNNNNKILNNVIIEDEIYTEFSDNDIQPTNDFDFVENDFEKGKEVPKVINNIMNRSVKKETLLFDKENTRIENNIMFSNNKIQSMKKTRKFTQTIGKMRNYNPQSNDVIFASKRKESVLAYKNNYRTESLNSLIKYEKKRANEMRRKKEEVKRVKRDTDPCDAFNYDEIKGYITHPYKDSSDLYSNNTDCTTVVKVPEGYVIELTFVDKFRIEYHSECAYDYLEIRDGEQGYSDLLGHVCGQAFPRVMKTKGPYAWLKFHSDDTIEYEGFNIKVTQLKDPSSYSIPPSCYVPLAVTDNGVIKSSEIDASCKAGSASHGLDVLWKIQTPDGTKIFLNFTEYELGDPNECDKNGIQIFGAVLELSAKLEYYCGSVANPVTSKAEKPGELGNVMHVRLYTVKAQQKNTTFVAKYTAFRTINPAVEADTCHDDEFDCADNTCINSGLRCNKYADCRLKTDEDNDLCKDEAGSPIKQTHILVILIIFSLILSGMMFVFLFKCIRKLYQDHKIIKEHIRQSCEDRLDRLDSLESRLTLDAKRLQRDSEPRASLERENQANEMFKRKRDSFSKRQPTSIDSDFQETHLNIDEEIWRREVEPQIEPEDILIERNGKRRPSRKEGSIRSKRVSEERGNRDVSVGAPDTKESGCQTRESLFQTDPPPSSDGKSSSSNSRGFSTFGYSGATIARPSPPTNTSEITIELLKQASRQDSVKPQKKIDRRPMSTETTRSAPDVIIVSKPIR